MPRADSEPDGGSSAAAAATTANLVGNAEHLQLMIDAVRDYAIFMLDPNGRIASWNAGAQRLKGYTASEALGRHFSVFYTQADRDRGHPEDELRRALADGRYQEEGWRVRKDGTQFWANVVITAVHDQDGKHVGFGKVTRDMTEARRAQEALREANAELEARVEARTAELTATNAELESFSYSVSHDLRAPLRALDGFSRLLLESAAAKLDAQEKDFIERIRAAAKRMGELTDAMLMLARLTRAPLRLERVNLSAIADTLVTELRRSEPGRNVEVVVAPDLVVQADARLMRIVLENLLGNAWKFTRPRANARIEVGRDDAATYFVRDNGVGFDPALSGKLFIPFQRLHRQGTFDGTGIGLATVHRAIARHRGRIWSRAAVDQGATFHFTLGSMHAG